MDFQKGEKVEYTKDHTKYRGVVDAVNVGSNTPYYVRIEYVKAPTNLLRKLHPMPCQWPYIFKLAYWQ